MKHSEAMEKFYETLSVDPDKAVYGLKDVMAAIEQEAILSLLITDGLLRSRHPQVRRKLVDSMEDVKFKGGSVEILSSEHVSGKKLDNLG